jgi:hypothetical protein
MGLPVVWIRTMMNLFVAQQELAVIIPIETLRCIATTVLNQIHFPAF